MVTHVLLLVCKDRKSYRKFQIIRRKTNFFRQCMQVPVPSVMTKTKKSRFSFAFYSLIRTFVAIWNSFKHLEKESFRDSTSS